MSFCVFDDDTVCRNEIFENNYGHRCIEADNLLNDEQTLCRYRILKTNTITSNEVCLYLFDGKCANKLSSAWNKSCVRNSGESCVFFIPEHKFIETKKQEAAQTDNVRHPSHYCQGGIECIKAIEASMTPEEFQGYCKGNVIKYCWRFREKNGLEDLKKAQVYLGWMIESKEKQEQNTH